MNYTADRTSSVTAKTAGVAGAVHLRNTAANAAARAALAAHEAAAQPVFDRQAAAVALARARAEDEAAGTTAAVELEAQQRRAAEDAAAGAAEYEAKLAELRRAAEEAAVAVVGSQLVLDEAEAASLTAVSTAARTVARPKAHKRYVAAVVELVDSVSDILAVDMLARLATMPKNLAIQPRRVELALPGLGAIDPVKDRDALAAVGAVYVDQPGDEVRLPIEPLRLQAMADFERIRAELEGRA